MKTSVCSSCATRSISSHCSRFVSWNSSTITMRKRSLRRLADRVVVAQQVARRELEILEVDDRLAALRGRVLDAEALEQLLQKVAVVGSELLERRALRCLPRLLVTRPRARPCTRTRTRSTRRSGAAPSPRRREQLARIAALGLRRRRRRRRALRLGAQRRRRRRRRARPLAELEDEIAPGRAERLVHARQHAAQPFGSIGREKPQTLRVAPGAELLPARARRPRRGGRPPPRPRARGNADRARPRTDARGGAGCRSRGWSRSRRRRARARDRAGRARAARRGCASAAPPPPSACT